MEKNRDFLQFDLFIIKEMGIEPECSEIQDETRKEAFQKFRKNTDKHEFASTPTMRRWFGIGGFAKPRREQIFEICLVLGCDKEKTEEYLKVGLSEPAIQINDYYEVIYLYGIENKISYEECLKMIREFELNLDEDFDVRQTQRTLQLMSGFEENKHLNPEEFLMWMQDNAQLFKGYSMTTYFYLEKYRKKIVSYIKKDAETGLELLLSETDFDKWDAHRLNHNKRAQIKKYCQSRAKKISTDLRDSILELAKIAYTEQDTNSIVLSEVFCAVSELEKRTKKRDNQVMPLMTGKYLSDLFNIPIQKERWVKVSQASSVLSQYGGAKCPEWIVVLCHQLSKGKRSVSTVEEAKQFLGEYIQEHRRRCLMIKRNDLLPLILYVAQRQYQEQIQDDFELYDKKEAKELFVTLANSTLNACNMAIICEQYEMDWLLLQCYQEDEMLSYVEMKELLYAVE